MTRVIAGAVLVVTLLLAGTAGVAGATGLFAWSYLMVDLPSPDQFEAPQFQTTKIYDRNWRLLSEVSDPYTGWRWAISYDELMDHIEAQRDDPDKPHRAWIVDATIAAEDQTFWVNPGVEPRAILRSLITNLSGESISGASTITQQVVRLLYPERIGTERTYTRKLREAVMAVRFTRRYTKEQILEMYLNNVYYGNRSYGIDAASQSYFNKFAWELSLAEAAMLAGLPQAPSVYDPTQNYELAKARQRYVLDRMVEVGMITRQQAEEAYAEPLFPRTRQDRGTLAPHFVTFVRAYLEQRYGANAVTRGGLLVRTSLDLSVQEAAQQIVSDWVTRLSGQRVNNGALVAMLPWSGEIIAMVGSADFANEAIDGQVNVIDTLQQPGSAIKPITYLAAFEKLGWHPGTVIFDYAKTWRLPGCQPYAPRNATRQHFGAITVREALGNSLNIPAIQALEAVGIPAMVDMAKRLGIRSSFWQDPNPCDLSITVGGREVKPIELTNAFATIANNGRYVPYTPILEIIAPGNQLIYRLDRARVLSQAEQVVRAEYAYQITHILADNRARSMIFGSSSPLILPELENRPVAAKTGTSEDARDLWTIGYTTDLVVGVWVGNTDNSPTRGLDGVNSAARIWHDFMVRVHQDPTLSQVLLGPDGQPIAPEFPRPPGIVEAPVCVATGKRPIPGARTVTEVLVHGGGPRLRCDQMSEWEQRELRAALGSREGMTQRGRVSLASYAAMVGQNPLVIDTERQQPLPTPQIGTPPSPTPPPEDDSLTIPVLPPFPIEPGDTAPDDDGSLDPMPTPVLPGQ